MLGAVTTTSPAEVEWITESVGRIFPEEWDRFEAASQRKSGQRVIDAYYELITDPDPAVREAAARDWCRWEDVHVSLDPNHTPHPDFDDPAYRMVFATLVIHYWKHAGFAGDGGLLAGMDKVAHIPGVLIHGRIDVSGPLVTALGAAQALARQRADRHRARRAWRRGNDRCRRRAIARFAPDGSAAS